MLFKSALFQSLKVKDFKYEDYLRSIYAKQVLNIHNQGFSLLYNRKVVPRVL